MQVDKGYFVAFGGGHTTRIYDVDGWCLLAAYEAIGQWVHKRGLHTARIYGVEGGIAVTYPDSRANEVLCA